MINFDDAFAAVIGVEKGFQDNPEDNGNWTGGEIGVGTCRGTKFGISAASYPDLDISNLTIEQAKALAKRDYWDRYQCDQFDIHIAFQVFDAAYNGGHAALWLQQAAHVHADGIIGAATVAAVRGIEPLKVSVLFDSYRLDYLATLSRPAFADGWMHRIAANLRRAAQ